MKPIFSSVIILAAFVAHLGCGVKGKPLPPLKKGEASNPSQPPKSP